MNLIDTRTAGAAVGLVALKAARLAAEGASADRVLVAAERCAASVCFFGYLETLHYLWKGGRIPRAALWMGNLLGVKPLLELSAGRVGMIGRPRSRARAIARMTALVRQWLNGAPCRLAVVHGGAPEPGAMLAEHLERELRPVELIMGEFTPVIGAHTGPGLVACAAHPVED
ncbi:MAG: DegV family EDD domain-containing protein [Dehalococcoidia bacterium]|nr:DegV family EDD domain-containing protein [Dehalococcoidia bacterium]